MLTRGSRDIWVEIAGARAPVWSEAWLRVLPIDILGELVSIGTLFSFTLVATGVLVLRRTHPDTPRPFRVPAVKVIAPAAIVCSVALMATLPVDTWIRLFVWLLIGLVIFFSYGRKRADLIMAKLVKEAEDERTPGSI